MWLNCTRSRVNPTDMEIVAKILADEARLASIRAAEGFRGLFLVESTEVPGEIIAITWWESAEDGQAYLASPECRQVAESVQVYLVRPLERQYYDVLVKR